jgi:uncharacterized protein (DUF302 family)
MTDFGIRKTLRASYDEALINLPEALKSEGFGVLTEIDLQHTLKQKLGVDVRRYKILGACNPPFAYEALQADLEVGLMLPCNVIVYEGDDGRTVVVAVDPTQNDGCNRKHQACEFGRGGQRQAVARGCETGVTTCRWRSTFGSRSS